MTQHTHHTAPTQFVDAAGIRFAYRRFGKSGGVPLVFNMHFTGTMDHWDPAVTDGFAKDREVILFNNTGVASTSGVVPDTIEQMAKTYDIKVAIHNHGPEDKRWPRPQDAYAAVKSRDKRLGLCIDIGHTLRTGTDPVQACRECRDRLYDMHVKDLAVKSEKESQVEVGRGVIDFPALLKTLIDIGYQGQVGLEYEIKAKDPLPGMIESMAYMRGVLAAVAT